MSVSFSGQLTRPQGSLYERIYVIIVLIYLSSAFEGLFEPSDDTSISSALNVGQLLLKVAIYAPAILFIARRWRSLKSEVHACRWALALAGLALGSALWADAPLFVLRKAFWVVATTVVGIYLGSRYKRQELVALLCYALGLTSVMSLLMVVLLPQYGLDPAFQNAEWRGIFETKNMLGRTMVLGLIALCSSGRSWFGGTVPRFFMLVSFGAMIVLSKSMTAAIVAFLLVIFMVIYKSARLRATGLPSAVIMLLFASTLIALTGINHLDALFGVFGRDESLTGRVPLWTAVLGAIARRPLLGYGFSSFWAGPVGPSAVVLDEIGWNAPHAHNGFLDLCLELGLFGLSIFAVGWVVRFRTAISEYRSGCSASIWPLAYLSFVLLYDLTESTLRLEGIYWALYTAALIPEFHGDAHRENPTTEKKNEMETHVNYA